MQAATRMISQVVVAGVLAVCAGAAVAGQNADALATVDRLHAALLEIMQDAESLGFDGRRDSIEPIVAASFDFRFITRFALGRYWSKLDESQRDDIVDVFSRWTVAHYAARFNSYSGQTFEVVSAEPARRERQLVRTVLEPGGGSGDAVTLDYLLHEVEADWRIINVIANGVSDLSLKRADYGAVMKTSGYDGLLERLNNQIREFASEQ